MEDTSSSQDEDIDLEFAGSQSVAENRILLTQEKYIEESIKNHLLASPSFSGMKFLVDVKDTTVVIGVLASDLTGASTQFTYQFSTNPDGNLAGVLEKLTAAIDIDLVDLRNKTSGQLVK